MKKALLILFILMLALFSCCAMAEKLEESEEYEDAPANSTYANILDIRATIQHDDKEPVEFRLSEMMPTRTNTRLVQEIYNYVEESQQSVASYFPLLVQAEMDRILEPMGISKDDLYMPEFMSLLPQISLDMNDVEVEMEFTMAYEPGRPVIIVLGWDDPLAEEGIQWYPIEATVTDHQTITYTIPQAVAETIRGQETMFSMLTVKPGSGRTVVQETVVVEPTFIPSIGYSETTRIEKEIISVDDGEPVELELTQTDPTEQINREIDKIREHYVDNQQSMMSLFDHHINLQTEYHLPEWVETDLLLAYEMLCLDTMIYEETYGDVTAKFSFLTPYHDGMHMVSLLGLPDPAFPDGELLWTPLYTVFKDGFVEITFSSATINEMMTETAFLLVMSTPLGQTYPEPTGEVHDASYYHDEISPEPTPSAPGR